MSTQKVQHLGPWGLHQPGNFIFVMLPVFPVSSLTVADVALLTTDLVTVLVS